MCYDTDPLWVKGRCGRHAWTGALMTARNYLGRRALNLWGRPRGREEQKEGRKPPIKAALALASDSWVILGIFCNFSNLCLKGG